MGNQRVDRVVKIKQKHDREAREPVVIDQSPVQQPDLINIANDINEQYRHAGRVLAEAQLYIGRKLLEARALFKGDNEFGKWREQHTPIRTASVALNLMKVAQAEQAGKLPQKAVENMSWTALLALSRLESGVAPVVTERVEKAIDKGRVPTASEVKAMATATQDSAEEEEPKAKTPKGPPFEEVVQKFLGLKLSQRVYEARIIGTEGDWEWSKLEGLDKRSLALLVIGVPFDSGYAPSDDVASAIFGHITNSSGMSDPDKAFVVQKIWPLCQAHWRTLRESNIG